MKSTVLWLCLLASTAASTQAQGTINLVPESVRAAYEAGTRSPTGAPGEKYWQVRPHYALEARLAPDSGVVVGKGAITVVNPSPHAWDSVVLRLDMNRFQSDSVHHGGLVLQAISVNGAEVSKDVLGSRWHRHRTRRSCGGLPFGTCLHSGAGSLRSPASSLRHVGTHFTLLASIVCRDAVPDDIPALAELHVTTWNATYRTSHGPTIETRTAQWENVFSRANPQEFILVLENAHKRLIGFAFGTPGFGEFEGVLSKIYLRWEYHGLGLGRLLMRETARCFLERGIESFVLFAERSNPTIGFYDRMGGERLLDERGLFTGAYGWREARTLLESGGMTSEPDERRERT
jgi:ribosomal protein S18 acetylase RimI-like enzyme